MLSRLLSLAFATLTLLALTPVPASAQIYVWRDAAGNMVLSDRPKDPSARTFAVATTGNLRVTRQAVSRRAAAYDDLIEHHSAAQGVRPALVRAVIQAESAYNPNARSVKGAMGLMQLMPATAAEYRRRQPIRSPGQHPRWCGVHCGRSSDGYDEKEELALAAYNAGPGAVEKYGNAVPPYRETIDYVGRIQGSMKADPQAHAPFRMYRVVQIIDGREVVKYSNVAAPGAELVSSASRR